MPDVSSALPPSATPSFEGPHVVDRQPDLLAHRELGVAALAFAAQLLLQREDRLRTRERVERHAPLDHFDQVVGVDAAQARERQAEPVFLDALRGVVRGIALHAGIDAGADGVDVGPGAHRRIAAVHLWRREAGRVHRADEVAFLGEHFARGAEIDHHRAIVVGHEDVGRLDVQVKHLVLVHDAQAAQDLVEQRTDGGLTEDLLFLEVPRGHDEILQGGALQVVHDHVDGFVLAEEVEHADHRGMRDLRERTPFLEKALQPQPVERQLFGRHLGRKLAGAPGCQGGRKVFLDGHLLATLVDGEVDDAETTGRKPTHDAITADDRVRQQGRRFDL